MKYTGTEIDIEVGDLVHIEKSCSGIGAGLTCVVSLQTDGEFQISRKEDKNENNVCFCTWTWKIDQKIVGRDSIIQVSGGGSGGVSDDKIKSVIKPIIKQKSIMKTLSTWLKKTLDADTQALYRAGYLDEDLSPSSKGYIASNDLDFERNRVALVEMAKAEILEAEAKK